jgi:tRNA threonylcarbamoyladenosine biosynthesis protein TsaE
VPSHKHTLDTLKEMAVDLARTVSPPFSILLSGELGSGKTTFAQFFIRSLLSDETYSITSPTFNIVQIYETMKGDVWHVDLYRVEEFRDVVEIGLCEAMHENICLIEWPGLLNDFVNDCRHTTICL